jgi:hypothetical protein
MNAEEIENLNAVAEKVAGKLGIRATIPGARARREPPVLHGGTGCAT